MRPRHVKRLAEARRERLRFASCRKPREFRTEDAMRLWRRLRIATPGTSGNKQLTVICCSSNLMSRVAAAIARLAVTHGEAATGRKQEHELSKSAVRRAQCDCQSHCDDHEAIERVRMMAHWFFSEASGENTSTASELEQGIKPDEPPFLAACRLRAPPFDPANTSK